MAAATEKIEAYFGLSSVKIGSMFTWRNILKAVAAGATLCAAMTALHNLLTFGTHAADSVAGVPIIPLLVIFVVVQGALIAIVYNMVQSRIQIDSDWLRGLLFGAFVALAVQLPAVFGMIVAEPGPQWEMFNAARNVTYATMVDDSLALLLTGAVVGLLFPRKTTSRASRSKGLGRAMLAGAVIFPVVLGVILHLLPFEDEGFPKELSLWYNAMFFGPFMLTGLCLPVLHRVTQRFGYPGRWRRVLYTTLMFCLLWLPVQNFMPVFGWDIWGGIVVSLVSLVPMVLVVYLADRMVQVVPDPAAGAAAAA